MGAGCSGAGLPLSDILAVYEISFGVRVVFIGVL